MTEAQVILATLIAYKVVLVAFGVLGQSRTANRVDFYLGGRQLGPVVAALSASASSSSAWTLMGVSGAAYKWGVAAVWLFPSCVGGFMLNWYVLAPALRRYSHENGALTMTEVIAGPPGRPLRRAIAIAASVIIIISLGSYVATQFQGAGKTFAETFELSRSSSVLLGGAVIALYTLMGGFWAASLSDSLQGLLMAAAAVVLPVAALIEVGGPAELASAISSVDQAGYLSLFRDEASWIAGLGFVVGLFGIGLGYPGQPHVVNRFMALEKGAAALRSARRIAIAWAAIIYAGMIVLGFCGRAILPDLIDHEVVMVELTRLLFHPVVAGLILASILSAIMSTADSQLLVVASSVTHDLGLQDRLPSALDRTLRGVLVLVAVVALAGAVVQAFSGEDSIREVSTSCVAMVLIAAMAILAARSKHELLTSRLVMLTVAAASVTAALYVRETIFAWVLFAWSAMGCAFGPLLLVTVLVGPVPPVRSLISILLGFSLSVLAYLGPQLHESLATKGTFFDRVLPFLLALAVVWPVGSRRQPRAGNGRETDKG